MGIKTLRTPPSEIITKIDWAEEQIRESQSAEQRDGLNDQDEEFASPVGLVDRIKQAKRAGDLETAEQLLIEAVTATEREAEKHGFGVAPWYYEHLAIVYRKQKRFKDEVVILERFANMPHAPGAKPAKLLKRLERAREIAVERSEQDKSTGTE